jgi:hypothetical protein
VQVESTVVRDSDAEHVTVVMAIKIKSSKWPESRQKTDPDKPGWDASH